MNTTVRLRFAPSPTGGLHIGGVRTALYAYLLAKKYDGKFILRIEDTDQSRYVDGAEQYIIDALTWCGIVPDEGPHLEGGSYGPYRQSERKPIYKTYAENLVENGFAYYAFDTEDDLQQLKNGTHQSYNHQTRQYLKNSLSLPKEEVQSRLQEGHYVIRFKNEPNQQIVVHDEIRGNISFDTSLQDDKVLLKSDGMPTYHLAVVVDDYLMKITHVFRGEEWLSSAPIHVDLWEKLGWKNAMPKWVHLPLILKPNGGGKLSKREAKDLGIPTFPLKWEDTSQHQIYQGYREEGFLPEGFLNMLALLGWSPSTEKEIFSMKELVEHFNIEHVHKTGAKFDYEKACWINGQHLKNLSDEALLPLIKNSLIEKAPQTKDWSDEKWIYFIHLIKERCVTLADFWKYGSFLLTTPTSYDWESIKPKWDEPTRQFFDALATTWQDASPTSSSEVEKSFNELASRMDIKAGKQMLPLRIMLVGGKFGPAVFDIAYFLGMEESTQRIRTGIAAL